MKIFNKMDRPIKLLFAGEGGQGIQTIAKLIAKAAFKQGFHIMYIPNFGVEQRGGVSLSFLQIWDKLVDTPKFDKADIVAITSDRAYERIVINLNSNTKILFDPYTVSQFAEKIKDSFKENYEVPAAETAKTQLNPRTANVIMMGAFNDILKIVDRQIVIDTMHEKFVKYYEAKPELKELNERAFKLGERFMPGGNE